MQTQVISHKDVVINDTQPVRVRDLADLLYSIFSLVLTCIVIFFAMYLSGTTAGVEHDARSAGKMIIWIINGVPSSLLQQGLTLIIVSLVLASMINAKKWFDTVLSTLTLLLTYPAVWAISYMLASFKNQSLFASLSSISNFQGSDSFELLPDMYAVLVAFLTVSGPRRDNRFVKISWHALIVASPILVMTSWHPLAGVLASWCIGRTIGTLIRFIKGTQTRGAWGDDIVDALSNIGIDNLVQLTRRNQQADHSGMLRSSLDDDLIENSRLYDAIDIHGNRYVISVLDNQVHLPGYINQLWQWIRLVDVPARRDLSARHSVHHHLSMLLALRNLRLATANFYGVTDFEKSSMMVFNAANAPTPCNLNTMTVDDATRFMRYLDIANSRGITHRRITPESLARLENGTPIIAGWHNGDVASDKNNIALDKVQLLTLISACIGIDNAVEAAIKSWGCSTLSELLPYMQKAAIPASTRALPAVNKKMLEELRNKVSKIVVEEVDEEDSSTIRLSRFNLRFFVSLVLAIVAIAVIITQLHPQDLIRALRLADPVLVVLCFICSMVAWIGSAITLSSFMDDSKPSAWVLFCSQAASGFTVVSMPAGVGPAFVNLQILKKQGYNSTASTAITSAVWMIQAIITASVMFIIGIFTGRNVLSGMVPTHMFVTVIGITTLVVSLCMIISPIRKRITRRYLPIISAYGLQIKEMISHPGQLIGGIVGAIILVISVGMGYWISLLAFGYYANPFETILLFLIANAAGSAIPTPGGLGAVEASLTFAFTSVGVPPTIALSATLLYRLMFYWLRIPLGAMSMHWLNKHNYI
ncbi:lysylphosphatidylglycerol synthase transmembrane domain-containing protein [Gardnerella vaginalis]|uniref:lysylphosphatidylglycerol synthase transmembrane domain-containing protein n=1 Tax=Gardnerella vaginalis TaxID=2702 RepID=UPI0039EFDE7A